MTMADKTKPRERPIVFSGEMVRAILNGRKTQTRRVVKPQPEQRDGYEGLHWRDRWADPADEMRIILPGYCPYGVPGDRLWVAEHVATPGPWNIPDLCKLWYPADGQCPFAEAVQYQRAEGMPRWASRLLLEIVAVRVERVQDISEADADTEGTTDHYYCEEPTHNTDGIHRCNPIGDFQLYWDSLNAERGDGWEANPWVWVITFRKIDV